MDIDRKHAALPGADRLPKAELNPDLTRAVRESIPKARAHVERALETQRAAAAEQADRVRTALRPDRIDLSAAARAYAAEGGDQARAESLRESEAERRQRVAQLKELHQAGRLHDNARIERAAERLLTGPQA